MSTKVILHVPATAESTGESPPPAGWRAELRIERRGLAFEPVALPPPCEAVEVASLGLSRAEMDRFADLRDALYGDGPHHQMGGPPDPVQSAEMALECQLVSHGLFCGDPSGYEDPRAEELGKGVSEWELLLQMDSDDDLDVMWGDAGMLYFWIRRDDAQNGDFDGAWMVLQCG